MNSPQSPAGLAARDRELCSRLQRRDPTALAEIYDRLAPRVYGLALRMLRSGPDAEDLTQEIFAAVWDRPGAYDPARSPMGAWILLLTRSRAVDRLRSMKARRDRGLVPGEGGELPEVLDPAPGPAEHAESARTGRAVREALARLPEAQRQAIEAAFLDGMTQTEVAERLGAPLGTVKTRIRDGMKRLRGLLESQAG